MESITSSTTASTKSDSDDGNAIKKSSAVQSKSQSNLTSLIIAEKWKAVSINAQFFSHETRPATPKSPAPISLACRHSAPFYVIESLLKAAPSQIRHVCGNGSTALHEAASNPRISFETLELLLSADASVVGGKRSALTQDVDGCTPLHLLLRGIFTYPHPETVLSIISLFIQSCPESCEIPDFREYEETPLILTLKASTIAPDYWENRESFLFEIVKLMLQSYPSAGVCRKSETWSYTPLHSAIFHGRCADIIYLLLRSVKRGRDDEGRYVYLTTGRDETAMHFASMRGESERHVKLLCEHGPMCVEMRDMGGLTPLHWLWVRFVGSDSVREMIDGDGSAKKLEVRKEHEEEENFDFAIPRSDKFDSEYFALNQTLDPPVDYRQMRYIPHDFHDYQTQCADTAIHALQQLQNITYTKPKQNFSSILHYYQDQEIQKNFVIVALFWKKVQYFLKAAHRAHYANSAFRYDLQNGKRRKICPPTAHGLSSTTAPPPFYRRISTPSSSFMESATIPTFHIVHTAARCTCAPPSVLYICLALHPKELSLIDIEGKLPLHHAAMRPVHTWSYPDFNHNQVCVNESSLDLVLAKSPERASRTSDADKRLPLHLAIDNLTSNNNPTITRTETENQNPILFLSNLINAFPIALEWRDGKTKLYPFLQAAVATTTIEENEAEALRKLTIVFLLMQMNPTLVSVGIQRFTQ